MVVVVVVVLVFLCLDSCFCHCRTAQMQLLGLLFALTSTEPAGVQAKTLDNVTMVGMASTHSRKCS